MVAQTSNIPLFTIDYTTYSYNTCIRTKILFVLPFALYNDYIVLR